MRPVRARIVILGGDELRLVEDVGDYVHAPEDGKRQKVMLGRLLLIPQQEPDGDAFEIVRLGSYY